MRRGVMGVSIAVSAALGLSACARRHRSTRLNLRSSARRGRGCRGRRRYEHDLDPEGVERAAQGEARPPRRRAAGHRRRHDRAGRREARPARPDRRARGRRRRVIRRRGDRRARGPAGAREPRPARGRPAPRPRGPLRPPPALRVQSEDERERRARAAWRRRASFTRETRAATRAGCSRPHGARAPTAGSLGRVPGHAPRPVRSRRDEPRPAGPGLGGRQRRRLRVTDRDGVYTTTSSMKSVSRHSPVAKSLHAARMTPTGRKPAFS